MPSRKPVRKSGHETMHEGDTCNTVVVQYVCNMSFLLQNNHGFHIAIYISWQQLQFALGDRELVAVLLHNFAFL